MLGILSFLVQWLALSHLGNRSYQPTSYQFSSPPKSHWSLLSEFQNLPEDEIEGFLPQICNILLDRDSTDEYGLFEHFERILIEKCAGCLTFGMRVCGLLKVHRIKLSLRIDRNEAYNSYNRTRNEIPLLDGDLIFRVDVIYGYTSNENYDVTHYHQKNKSYKLLMQRYRTVLIVYYHSF